MKILVLDDHALIRDAMRGVLGELAPDAVVIEAANGEQALRRVAEHADLELLLLDLSLPDRDGLGLLADLRHDHPAIAIVVLSARNERDDVVKALRLGALGFIPKNAGREIILSALRLVLAGGIYIPPEILAQDEASATLPVADDLGLTGRQRAVLALVMQGKSNKVIGRELALAEPTVKNHVTAILKALKVNNRTEAVIAARERGLERLKA